MNAKQRFLFLQGVCSPFFPTLAKGLRQEGMKVRKVNFSVGDRIYWRQGDAISYRGSMDQLPEFYRGEFDRHGITDVVLFGDCRPVHRPAIELARDSEIRVHVFEEGYFRPYWVTLERGGVNGYSALPRDPDYYRKRATELPNYDNGTSFSSPFWKRAAYDVGYNFWAGLNPILHRGVKSHVPYSPATEYASYLRKGIGTHISRRRAKAIQTMVTMDGQTPPYYLFPLQLTTDSQIIHHSNFASMSQALDTVIRSFARHAPAQSLLLIKAHPLDPGLVNYSRLIRRLSRQLMLGNRVVYIDGGHLPSLINRCTAVITINSTVGASALIHGKPTKALGRAIYDMPGLTDQKGLDEFWKHQDKPDVQLFRKFRNVVIHDTQINGGFYCKSGIALSVTNSLRRLLV
ncbi:capsule biosynthesis protein [Achromobacter sp. MFA1 R4]|uniref:capsule biosynthesis protein n=1 Tax=Achromobacter sp. MFA1 R4 TaxID=1881016 RepID=UPI0009537A84|nr:capsular biosynthesis protein [Achromobacter sp. MFA1 R4]SIT31357.1 capsular polysaccharide export protein [Achromobacter sp. MFA1 R4]